MQTRRQTIACCFAAIHSADRLRVLARVRRPFGQRSKPAATPVHRSPPYSQEADAALSELQYQKLFATAGGSRVTIYELMPDGSFEPLQVRNVPTVRHTHTVLPAS